MQNEIVKVNGYSIECPYENEQHYVAIKPICQALGIDHQKQFERIKSDEILCQLYTDTVYNWGADGKRYKMICLPLKFVFGWLFSIDESKVNEQAKPIFRQYKMECYHALYEHFNGVTNDRRKTLLDKAVTLKRIKEKQDALKANPDYIELMELQGKILKSGKDLKQMDLLLTGVQIDMFEEEVNNG